MPFSGSCMIMTSPSEAMALSTLVYVYCYCYSFLKATWEAKRLLLLMHALEHVGMRLVLGIFVDLLLSTLKCQLC